MFLKNKKIAEFAISCPTTLFCLSFELSGIEPVSTAELPTTLTNKPNTQVKDSYLYMYMKPFRSAEWVGDSYVRWRLILAAI